MKKYTPFFLLLLCILCLASAQASGPSEVLTKRFTDFAVMDGSILTCQNCYYTNDSSEHLETSIYMQPGTKRPIQFDHVGIGKDGADDRSLNRAGVSSVPCPAFHVACS